MMLLCRRGLFNYPCPRKLRQIVKLSLLEREPSDKISEIWQGYHKERDRNVSFTWSTGQYQQLKANSQKARIFVYPVFRKGGHFMLISQYVDKSFLFTYLEQYKRKGSQAQPFLVLTCFEQLLTTKGLCLIRGDIINYHLSNEEALKASENLLTYTLDSHLYSTYVWAFNNAPEQFDLQKYMATFNP